MQGTPIVISKSTRVYEVEGTIAAVLEFEREGGYKQVWLHMVDGSKMSIAHPDNREYEVDLEPGLTVSGRSFIGIPSLNKKTGVVTDAKHYVFNQEAKGLKHLPTREQYLASDYTGKPPAGYEAPVDESADAEF